MAEHGPLLDRISERIELDMEEGDIAYFHALSLHLEFTTKIVTAAVVACVGDDADRHRYSLEHRLVRGDSIGDWVGVLNDALTGPAAQFVIPEARRVTSDLTERVSEGDWRWTAVQDIHVAAAELGAETSLGSKVALRQFFQIGVALRNKSRGHGATTSTECSRICPILARSIAAVAEQCQILQVPWAYLHRNLSGKYRVSPLLGDCSVLDYLKRVRDVSKPNGVYIHIERPIIVRPVFSDPDVGDILVANGAFRNGTFEVLSYISNESRRYSGEAWSAPRGRLPQSETEGSTALEQVGNTFANIPPKAAGYVRREKLEGALKTELFRTDRRPTLSLTGPGGIGKTTLAIAALSELTEASDPPYEVILWMSARDIDLLDAGPKPVSPGVVAQRDIARAAVALLEPRETQEPGFDPERFFEGCLQKGAAGPTLFVLDNFETVESPSDVFNWIDAHVRPPNKVLITTRFRTFAGDYPIHIGGMTDDEALALIDREAARLEISSLLDSSYKDELIRESDGHPYVIKILLGQVAKERRAVKPERIVASADYLLTALFERTFGGLTPGAQRVFLLLCSWRVFVPEIAVVAVSLRPGNERFNITEALEELSRFSLVEEVSSEADNTRFIGVPLPAAMYGRKKLDASPFKAAVEEDRKVLMEFGAGRREDVQWGAYPRVERLVRAVARDVSSGTQSLDDALPVLEYLASQVPKAYLNLADLVLEADPTDAGIARAKSYLRAFIETADSPDRSAGWLRLAELCQTTGDSMGEAHALSEVALQPSANADQIEQIANRLNNRIRELKGERIEDAWSPEMRVLIGKVIEAMERHLNDLSATGCSRLAWLQLNVRSEDRAREVTAEGLRRDPTNEFLLNLRKKLGE